MKKANTVKKTIQEVLMDAENGDDEYQNIVLHDDDDKNFMDFNDWIDLGEWKS